MKPPMLRKPRHNKQSAWLLIIAGMATASLGAGSAQASPWRDWARFAAPQAQQIAAAPASPSMFARTYFQPSFTPRFFASSYTPNFAPNFSNRVGAAAFTQSATATALPSASFVESPYFQYLLWRRSLNPARFDYYHPRLGPLLESITQLPQEVFPPLIPPIVPQVTPPPTKPTVPEIPVVPQVPEPSTLLIGLVLTAGGFWARHARGKVKRLDTGGIA